MDLTQREDLILGPFFPRFHAGKGNQFLIGTGTGEENGVEAGLFRKIAIFIIGNNVRILCPGRIDARNICFDIPCAHRFHDGDTFIAFNDIIVSHILEGSDRLVDALALHALIQVIPFCSKFTAALQNGEKVLRERFGTPFGYRTEDPGKGNRHNTQGKSGKGSEPGNPGLQNGEIRVFVRLKSLCINAQPVTTGFSVMIHSIPPMTMAGREALREILCTVRDGADSPVPARTCGTRTARFPVSDNPILPVSGRGCKAGDPDDRRRFP